MSVFRDALLKMKEVYEQSPQMGDADSLEPRLEEVKQILQKLDEELKRNQVYTANAPYLWTLSAVHTARNRHPTMCWQVCLDVLPDMAEGGWQQADWTWQQETQWRLCPECTCSNTRKQQPETAGEAPSSQQGEVLRGSRPAPFGLCSLLLKCFPHSCGSLGREVFIHLVFHKMRNKRFRFSLLFGWSMTFKNEVELVAPSIIHLFDIRTNMYCSATHYMEMSSVCFFVF